MFVLWISVRRDVTVSYFRNSRYSITYDEGTTLQIAFSVPIFEAIGLNNFQNPIFLQNYRWLPTLDAENRLLSIAFLATLD